MNYRMLIFMLALLAAHWVANAQVDGEQSYGDAFVSRVDPIDVSKRNGSENERVKLHRFDANRWKDVVDGANYTESETQKKRESENKKRKKNGKGTRTQNSDSDDNASSGFSFSMPMGGGIIQWIVYGTAIALIAFILVKVFLNATTKTSKKISKPVHVAHTTIEDIKELEIDRLLREAIQVGNYRLVVRIYYLGLLQKLDEDRIIIWQKNKTNRDYLSELFQKEHYFNEIKKLTIAYEEVWYGDHNLPLKTYEEIIASFKSINQQLLASTSRETR